MNKEQIKKYVRETNSLFQGVSDRIWEFAELKFEEYKSSNLQQQTMREMGFDVTAKIAGMKTAFVASKGSGHPIIGFLGEFDALPGLSQECTLDEKKPIKEGGSGHGCGHNLLGSAVMQAACAAAQYTEDNELPGTVRYYGCPGEETGAGKAFMVREGCFDDVDICISWHPGSINAFAAKTVANIHVYYSFLGKASHAAAAPELGRSALDAAELMNVGVNYLREHVTPDVRMQYAFIDAGGEAPNIVQATAEMIYAVRANTVTDTAAVYERVNKVARGAAMMTETEVEIRPVSAYANILDNDTLADLVAKHMEEDVDTKEITPMVTAMISSDVGDVSWVVPTACFYLATAVPGTQLHSWQMTAQGKSQRSHEGMARAAKIMASTAAEIFEDHTLIEKAKEDQKKAMNGEIYHTLIPEDVKPGAE